MDKDVAQFIGCLLIAVAISIFWCAIGYWLMGWAGIVVVGLICGGIGFCIYAKIAD